MGISFLRRRLIVQGRPRLKEPQQIRCETSRVTLSNQLELKDVGAVLVLGASLNGGVLVADERIVIVEVFSHGEEAKHPCYQSYA